MRKTLAVVALAAATLTARTSHAGDPFEIQVYDGKSNAPGAPGLELHVNTVASGVRTGDPPQLPQNGQSHFTLEPSLGITRFWEIGGYLQTALRKDGEFDYAGTKLRSKFVTPPGWDDHFRLGVNLELSLIPSTYDRDRWGTEVRPIAAWEDERFVLVVNPIVTTPLAGDGFGNGPAFEPAGMALVKVDDVVSLGIEYYATLGPFSHILPWHEQEHYLFEVANLLSVEDFELNIGAGEGLTAASNGFVAKVIVGYEWDFSKKPVSR